MYGSGLIACMVNLVLSVEITNMFFLPLPHTGGGRLFFHK